MRGKQMHRRFIAGVGLLVVLAGATATLSTPASAAQDPGEVTLSVPGGSAELREYQVGHVYVAVNNPTTAAITVTGFDWFGQEHLSVCTEFSARGEPQEDPDCRATAVRDLEISVPAGDVKVLPWAVKFVDQVEEGKTTVLFQATYVDAQGPHSTPAVAHDLDVSVLGSSGLLDALKIPIFLFLPGYLMLVAFYWMTGLRTRPALIEQLTPSSPQAWAVGVLLSLGAIPLYPVITSWFGPARSYLSGYGVRDFAYVWIGSVAVGVALALLYLLGLWLRRVLRARYVDNRTPDVDDDPLTILRKLSVEPRWWGGMPKVKRLRYPQVRVKDGDQVVQVFKLGEVAGQTDHVWIAPPIAVRRARLDLDVARAASAAADADDPAAFVAALADDRDDVVWLSTGGFDGPELVATAALQPSPRLRDRRIIEDR